MQHPRKIGVAIVFPLSIWRQVAMESAWGSVPATMPQVKKRDLPPIFSPAGFQFHKHVVQGAILGGMDSAA